MSGDLPATEGASARGQLEQEAAQWCAVMHGDEAAERRSDFEAWLRRGAHHRLAYNRMEEVYLLGSHALHEPGVGVAASGRAERPKVPRSRVLVSVTVSGLLACALGLYLFFNHGTPRPSEGTRLMVATRQDGPETLRFTDGSQVTLNGSSLLKLVFFRTSRSALLLAGSARFDIAPDERPFVLKAGRGSVTTSGASFDAAFIEQGAVRITLLAGSASLMHESDRNDRVHVGLRVGRSEVIPGGGGANRPGDPSARSHIAVQPRTVGELVDAANRSASGSTRIVVADRSLRELRLGGHFSVRDPRRVAEQLSAMLDLEVDARTPDMLKLTRRRPGI